MSSGFVVGTLVHTDKGLIAIQNLQVGDLVLSNSKDKNGEYIGDSTIQGTTV